MTRPLTAPLPQVALHRSNVVDMPPSTYRPSPPTARPRNMPPSALEPNRSVVEGYSPPARETTLRSAPEPPENPAPEVSDVAGKKKKARGRVVAEDRAVAVARVDKLTQAGNSTKDAIAAVAKELGVSDSAVYNWRTAARNAAPATANGAVKAAPKLDGLDLILDIIELCERAKKGLSKSQRARLKAAIDERLS
jgi:transposase-like protein